MVFLEITHFGQEYTHQGKSQDQSLGQGRPERSADESAEDSADDSARRYLTRRSSPFESLTREVLEGLYRHYWLDFVLLGYEIPEELQ